MGQGTNNMLDDFEEELEQKEAKKDKAKKAEPRVDPPGVRRSARQAAKEPGQKSYVTLSVAQYDLGSVDFTADDLTPSNGSGKVNSLS